MKVKICGISNEIDALANINFNTRTEKDIHRELSLVRIGTCGGLQPDTPIGTFIATEKSIGFDGLLNFYAGRNEVCDIDFEEHFKKPVILTDYPKEIKAFYMKQNEDGKTVRAMDVLFPHIGEIIGGSEREENYDKLLARIEELGIPMKDMWWYLDTRKYGTCPHGGFGLGFERLILFVTGMQNIRDVIPFPRTPKTAEF